MEFHEIYLLYRQELDRVERLLDERARADHADLAKAGRTLLEAGGKRIRPLFALICGLGEREWSEDVAKVAAALEMIHMATLVHDDVIDRADLRRGRPTVRKSYGNLAAMYTGDYLFARAIQLLAEVDNLEVHRLMAKGIVLLCEGEIEQIEDFYNWSQGVMTYLRRIHRKTALLISLSCQLGAMVGGVHPREVAALARFGHAVGMAFQIVDDLLDFTGAAEIVGKPVGGDLRQGNLTLPALLASSRPGIGERLRALVREGMREEEAEEAIQLVVASGALADAERLAERYLEKSRELLQGVGRETVREQLMGLTSFILRRQY
ncbi:polyprenyl synthetase family protein [Alicyclobacillus acidocaldarius]|uniref:Polyprenyl synthetase n=1 Tax=Alicyclobacillus acidocaldarius (strain Tc-4-1) TaxID=1048834 RepID=F8IK07_ALIAT|nr:polyprenyl synthetase family protein [Alicyclobacillus acidocaldarius]AEJ43519.1 Polyprenyl synthetase [Alicyclobacillus acidocaldarius subsp. acidocaldarius Tc-4-1]